jgi:hypothetical protein
LLTSVSALPVLRKIAHDAGRRRDYFVHVEPVINHFFGENVTVAGLLTARDSLNVIRRAVQQCRFTAVLLPAVMFNYAGYTLDGYSPQRLSEAAGIAIKPIRDIGELLAL